MGEYATYAGQRIKIGTCEEMLYLRPDQIDKVTPEGFQFTEDTLTSLLFRFPFPDEDTIEPGEFRDSDRGFAVWDYEHPDGVEHGKVQFKADAGILISLPCPYSPEAQALEVAANVRYGFNGYRGPVRIRHQRVWAGCWVTAVECGACRTVYRLPGLADAEPLLTALERMAVVAGSRRGGDYDAVKIREIANRIRTGYLTPAPFAAATA